MTTRERQCSYLNYLYVKTNVTFVGLLFEQKIMSAIDAKIWGGGVHSAMQQATD